MSPCPSVVPSLYLCHWVQLFPRPPIGPEITWSVSGLSLILSPPSFRRPPQGLFNRINPLAKGVAPAIVMSPQRHHFSWGHHFRYDCPLNYSQLNCHKSSGTGKFSYSSASAPHRHHFSWGPPSIWGHSLLLSVNWTIIREAAPANLAIPVPLLFWWLLPVPHLFPYRSSDWTTVFCIANPPPPPTPNFF